MLYGIWIKQSSSKMAPSFHSNLTVEWYRVIVRNCHHKTCWTCWQNMWHLLPLMGNPLNHRWTKVLFFFHQPRDQALYYSKYHRQGNMKYAFTTPLEQLWSILHSGTGTRLNIIQYTYHTRCSITVEPETFCFHPRQGRQTTSCYSFHC